jgi:hypothetical protein
MPWTEITRDQYRREGLRYLRPGDGPFGAFWLERDGLSASRPASRPVPLRVLCLKAGERGASLARRTSRAAF